jgi:hypothetical protein
VHNTNLISQSYSSVQQTVNSPIFIIGLHRTGSTVWHNLIAMYPEICRLADPRVLGTWWQKDFRSFLKTQTTDLSVDENVARMVESMLSRREAPGLDGVFWRFENFEEVIRHPEFRKSLSAHIKQSDGSPLGIFRALVDNLVRFSGRTRACVKFPVDIAHVPALVAAFPDCRIIHISRDPRAMALSKTNDPGGTAKIRRRHPLLASLMRPGFVAFAAWQYMRSSRVHRKYRHLPNYRLFLYEDLLADPTATMKKLCEFAGLEFSAARLRLEEGQHRQQRSSLTGKQTLELDKRAATRWQSAISPFERWVVTLLTRRSMHRFGYDPSRHPIFE